MPEPTNQVLPDSRPAHQPGPWWWLRQLLLTGVAVFFSWFGIAVLVGAYGLGDPFSFVMTFFAASLIIMISLVMVVAFALRMWRVFRSRRRPNSGQAAGP